MVCGRKLKHPEETYADRVRTCSSTLFLVQCCVEALKIKLVTSLFESATATFEYFFQDAGSRAVKSHDKQTQYKQRFAVWVSTKWMHIKEITDVSFKLDSQLTKSQRDSIFTVNKVSSARAWWSSILCAAELYCSQVSLRLLSLHTGNMSK